MIKYGRAVRSMLRTALRLQKGQRKLTFLKSETFGLTDGMDYDDRTKVCIKWREKIPS